MSYVIIFLQTSKVNPMENQNVEFFIKKIDFILKKFDYEGYNDIEVGDILEVYEEIAVKKKLK